MHLGARLLGIANFNLFIISKTTPLSTDRHLQRSTFPRRDREGDQLPLPAEDNSRGIQVEKIDHKTLKKNHLGQQGI
jgi:hypothetical protein